MLTRTTAGAVGRHGLRSAALYDRGRDLFPSGVSRSTIDIDPFPVYVEEGDGAYVTDADGNRLLDFNNNFTTLFHGHAFEPVVEAVAGLLRKGTCFSNPTRHEIALAELMIARIPAIEKIRFVNSGTEAVMFAIKAARAYTGRAGIARFAGAYHGAYDWAETGQSGCFKDARTGRLTPRPAYAGAPDTTPSSVLVLDFNDSDGLEEKLSARAGELAAVLIDPMPSRAGLTKPRPEFIERLNAVAHKFNILIIADEVLNLRQGFHGASARYGLKPDLITAGKIIGGGFPIGAIGGRADVMEVFSSQGKAPRVPQGGTFSANPVSMVAGLVAMEAATKEEFDRLESLGDMLRQRLSDDAAKFGAPFSIAGAASLFRIHPKRNLPTTYHEATMTAEEILLMRRVSRFFRRHGILLPFDAAACLSTPMNETDIGQVCDVFEMFLANDDSRYQEAAQ